MKNLLLNAVNELVVKANNELKLVRNDIAILPNRGDKLNRVYEGYNNIISLVDRINALKDKLVIDFPDEHEEVEEINKAVHIVLIQIEDVLNIVYEVGNVMIDDLDNDYEECDYEEA